MLERGRGHLLFMSSIAGKAIVPGNPLYHATKFGLRGFAAAPADRPARRAASVSPAVFPGFIRDAGMFADSGVKLPPGVGTRSPEDVARGVVDAIERNRGEVDVAPAHPARRRDRSPGSPPSSRRASRAGSAVRRSRARWSRDCATSAELVAGRRECGVLRSELEERLLV